MKKILILLMLLCGLFMYATDDYMTNNPRYRIINPADGNIPRWNETYKAFDCGSTTGTYSIDAGEYMLLPASGTLTNNQFAGARVITLTAGYGTTAIGDLVYLNNDDSKFEKTDGNAAATAADVLVGVVLQAVAEDASCLILLEGTITVDAWNWATVGASVWISGTAGGFVQTRLAVANDIVRIMGYAIDDDTIYFCPDNAYVTVE